MADAEPKSRTTIRRSLIGNLVVLVALTGGAILAASWVAADRTVDELARLLIDPTSKRVAAELNRFFGDVRSHVLVGKDWAQRGALDPTDYVALNDIFVPVLEQYPQISSMMVADSNGVEYLLLRDALEPDVWVNRVVRADEWGTRVFNRRWNQATGEVIEGFGELDYDPRRRIWYEEALQTTSDEPVFWTEPVIFFITKDPGVTASTHLRSPTEPTATIVVAFDLLLLDISRFTSQLEVSENGRAFVLVEREGEEGLHVVGLPSSERYQDDTDLRDALIFVPPEAAAADAQARLPSIAELDAPAIEAAVESWRREGRPETSIEYTSAGQAWLTEFKPYTVGRNTFWIGVALPQSDLLPGVRAQRIALLAVVLAILVVGLARAFVLARRFSAPVESLVHETERMAEGDLSPGPGLRSSVREYLRLAEAQEAMRDALHARMRLEKIENDLDIARDIQRGLLPTSAPDTPGFRVEGWSRAADQTGGDYFDWLTLPDGRTLITLADATGHGIGPALIVSVCRAYMRAAAMDPDVALSGALSRVNDLLHDDMPMGRFITAAVGVLNPEMNAMSLLSAGQAPLFFVRAATGEVDRWDADELPLGIAPGVEFGAARRIQFDPGDTLVLVTDGFFEWANPDREQFGMDRLEAFVAENAKEEPEVFIERLHEAVLEHANGASQPDDLTVVVVKRLLSHASPKGV